MDEEKEVERIMLEGLYEMLYRGEISREMILELLKDEEEKAEITRNTEAWFEKEYSSWKEEKLHFFND